MLDDFSFWTIFHFFLFPLLSPSLSLFPVLTHVSVRTTCDSVFRLTSSSADNVPKLPRPRTISLRPLDKSSHRPIKNWWQDRRAKGLCVSIRRTNCEHSIKCTVMGKIMNKGRDRAEGLLRRRQQRRRRDVRWQTRSRPCDMYTNNDPHCQRFQ